LGVINILDKHTAELIAAGEVVERPASIVKELLENSIDAGADSVTVEIKNGGISFIRVTDNGSGILHEDVRSAFKSHATSKISNGADLDSIGTLGFRGEALASIAAVAKVELLTRCKNDEEGVRYAIEGGEETAFEPSGCPAGTTIIVRDIFYNTPARMKFLKKDVSEANAVAIVVDKLALSHPELTFRFIRDGELRLLTPGNGDLRSVIYEVFDRDFSSNLLPVDYEYGGMKVYGFISKPTAARSSRTLQNFFINGRYVRPRTCSAAIEEACKGSIMTGKFPACVLFLSMPPASVDVNVHPAKLEVRFHSEHDVFEAVYYSVRQALSAGEVSPLRAEQTVHQSIGNPYSLKPDAPAQRQTLFESPVGVSVERPDPQSFWERRNAVPENTKKKPDFWQSVSYRNTASALGAKKEQAAVQQPMRVSVSDDEFAPVNIAPLQRLEPMPQKPSGRAETITSEKPTVQKKPQDSTGSAGGAATFTAHEEVQARGRIIGELFDTYILIEAEGELLMVDKHAAHERYIYEQLKAGGEGMESQLLLTPEPVTLSREEHLALMNGLEAVTAGGFEIDDFGDTEVLVRAVPMWTEKADIADIVRWMAGALLKGADASLPDFLDELYHSIACRSAVKAHDKGNDDERRYIVEMVAREDIRYCPHGRPVVCSVTKRQIEKMFKRLV